MRFTFVYRSVTPHDLKDVDFENGEYCDIPDTLMRCEHFNVVADDTEEDVSDAVGIGFYKHRDYYYIVVIVDDSELEDRLNAVRIVERETTIDYCRRDESLTQHTATFKRVKSLPDSAVCFGYRIGAF
uniref:Uncharacterized protein n=1 Tax=viral metagenome TaxID=1070528 RepID=A0A6C0LYA0_9ZZZZ